MSRSSYDDMPDSRMNNRYSGNRGKTGLIAIAGILIALLCIILFLIFTPSDKSTEEKASEPSERAALSVEEAIPEISIPEPVFEEKTEETLPEPAVIETPEKEETKGSALTWNTYSWQEGDDIKTVASIYGVSADTIILINDIPNISNIKAGTELRIPSMDGRVYIVHDGDSASTIISRFNPLLSEKELFETNGITELKAGEELFIPTPEEEYITSANPEFSSPINGKEIITYGEYYNGYKIDGIVYSAKSGEAVKAVLPGFVVDAGINPIYGKFVSLMHEDGYKSSYYALESVDVVTGENVEKGSVIGSVGSSNTYFNAPALLFKVEQSGIKINPDNLLR